jgi:hypothetical protein
VNDWQTELALKQRRRVFWREIVHCRTMLLLPILILIWGKRQLV